MLNIIGTHITNTSFFCSTKECTSIVSLLLENSQYLSASPKPDCTLERSLPSVPFFKRVYIQTSNRFYPVIVSCIVLVAAGLIIPGHVEAGEFSNNSIFGVRLRGGWKYDNVRMCGATGPGAPHGPDLDISLFSELPLWEHASLDLNLPVFRPLLFAIGAEMIQFEPEATLLFRDKSSDEIHLIAGPSLGLSIHYGPDYNSEMEGDGRTASFWAIGPRVGGYVGIDFIRPNKDFNFQLGMHPYIIRLISMDNTQNHNGRVAGATLDSSFRFHTDP